MTTGNVTTGMCNTTKTQEDLCTKFVFEKGGEAVVRAIWSFANDSLDTAGPAMEVFEADTHGTEPEVKDLGFVLATMENKMIELVAPLVAFRLRFCNVDDPGVSKWLSQRGYTETVGHGAGRCKAFVVF